MDAAGMMRCAWIVPEPLPPTRAAATRPRQQLQRRLEPQPQPQPQQKPQPQPRPRTRPRVSSAPHPVGIASFRPPTYGEGVHGRFRRLCADARWSGAPTSIKRPMLERLLSKVSEAEAGLNSPRLPSTAIFSGPRGWLLGSQKDSPQQRLPPVGEWSSAKCVLAAPQMDSIPPADRERAAADYRRLLVIFDRLAPPVQHRLNDFLRACKSFCKNFRSTRPTTEVEPLHQAALQAHGYLHVLRIHLLLHYFDGESNYGSLPRLDQGRPWLDASHIHDLRVQKEKTLEWTERLLAKEPLSPLELADGSLATRLSVRPTFPHAQLPAWKGDWAPAAKIVAGGCDVRFRKRPGSVLAAMWAHTDSQILLHQTKQEANSSGTQRDVRVSYYEGGLRASAERKHGLTVPTLCTEDGRGWRCLTFDEFVATVDAQRFEMAGRDNVELRFVGEPRKAYSAMYDRDESQLGATAAARASITAQYTAQFMEMAARDQVAYGTRGSKGPISAVEDFTAIGINGPGFRMLYDAALWTEAAVPAAGSQLAPYGGVPHVFAPAFTSFFVPHTSEDVRNLDKTERAPGEATLRKRRALASEQVDFEGLNRAAAIAQSRWGRAAPQHEPFDPSNVATIAHAFGAVTTEMMPACNHDDGRVDAMGDSPLYPGTYTSTIFKGPHITVSPTHYGQMIMTIGPRKDVRYFAPQATVRPCVGGSEQVVWGAAVLTHAVVPAVVGGMQSREMRLSHTVGGVPVDALQRTDPDESDAAMLRRVCAGMDDAGRHSVNMRVQDSSHQLTSAMHEVLASQTALKRTAHPPQQPACLQVIALGGTPHVIMDHEKKMYPYWGGPGTALCKSELTWFGCGERQQRFAACEPLPPPSPPCVPCFAV